MRGISLIRVEDHGSCRARPSMEQEVPSLDKPGRASAAPGEIDGLFRSLALEGELEHLVIQ